MCGGRNPREVNEFVGNDFRDADLLDVDFRYGIDLSLQMLPVDEKYLRVDRARERIARARLVVDSWTDSNDRAAAMDALRILSGGGNDEQEELFLHKAFFEKGRPTVAGRLWDLLEEALPSTR